jgi:hypothetical protein
VIVLSFTVVDAQLLETEMPGFRGNSKVILEQLGFGDEYQELRLLRNRIIHIDTDRPAITVDRQWSDREDLQETTEHAIRLMLAAFFSNPSL